MDTGVELSEKARGSPYRDDFVDEHGGDEDAPQIANHPVVRRQNNCFLLALVACVLAFAVYVVSDVYSTSDPLRHEYGEDSSMGGQKGVDIGSLDVGGAAGSMHHTKGKGKDYMKKQKEIELWQNTTVTLRDGTKYRILEKLAHDRRAFTEGLTYVNGRLFESVGLYQQSQLRELDPETGEVVDAWPMDQKYFAEGLTYVDGKLIQLTYKRNTGFIYNFTNLSATPSTFSFQTITREGWGMTYDKKKHEIIVSDGSEYLFFWDPDTMTEKRRIAVKRQFDKIANNINELEFWRGRVLANVWYEDSIIVINPETGIVEKEYGEFVAEFVCFCTSGAGASSRTSDPLVHHVCFSKTFATSTQKKREAAQEQMY